MADTEGKPITGARAWRGADLASTEWVTHLSANEVNALNALAHNLPSNDSEWLSHQALAQSDPSLSLMLSNASQALSHGKGFVLLRGLDAGDVEQLRRVFWIIGTGLGEPVMQNARGEVLSVVADRFAGAERGVDTRGYESNDELRFHCDGGDCIGMSCIRQAPRGGTNGLVSLFAVYNEILEKHPRHLPALTRGYPLYARKEQGDAESTKKLGQVQQTRIPVFAWHERRMSAWLNLQLAELAATVSGIAYSEEEKEALNCVEAIANQPDVELTFKQLPGDVLFVNNLAVMHRREKYFDAEEPHKKRALYRMWINLHQSAAVVPQHAALRSGIRGPSPVIAAA
jgi:hypothetical protein